MKENLKVEKYVNNGIELDVKVDYENKTVYLNTSSLALLCNKTIAAIRQQINKISNSNSVVIKLITTGSDNKQYYINYYPYEIIVKILAKNNSEILNNFISWTNNIFIEINNISHLNNVDIVRFIDGEISINVSVSYSEDTVWLTQDEIALLYCTKRNTISWHIKQIYLDLELEEFSVCRKNRRTGNDGKSYLVSYYNLDMILAIGYRVKSKRGIEFRKWASTILKNYALNGYIVNDKKCMECKDNIISLNNKVEYLFNNTNDLNTRVSSLEKIEDKIREMLFFENNMYEPYSFIKDLFNSAKESITIIDGYVDKSVLDMLNEITLDINIYTLPCAKLTNLDIEKFAYNHSLNLIKTNNCHDRFIIIDNICYIVGSSIKDIGKKLSYIIKTSFNKDEIIKDI